VTRTCNRKAAAFAFDLIADWLEAARTTLLVLSPLLFFFESRLFFREALEGTRRMLGFKVATYMEGV
jgi:hypothetical protein